MPLPAPEARRSMVRFENGYVTGAKATLDLIFGPVTPVWRRATGETAGGRRRRAPSRQRSSAATGELMKVRFEDGDTWGVRLVGAHIDFINGVLAGPSGEQINAIWSEKGTIYAKEAPAPVD